jgi:Family of unknown function (DUF6084)
VIEPAFAVEGVAPEPFAAVPTLDFDVRVSEPSGREIYMLALTAGITVGTRPWTRQSALVPAFTGETAFTIAVPCSYESLHGIEGEAPLVFHFNGTIFYRGDAGSLQMELVPWSCSVDYALPMAVWRELFPDGAWVALRTDTLDALRQEAARRGAPTLDACLEELLRCSTA